MVRNKVLLYRRCKVATTYLRLLLFVLLSGCLTLSGVSDDVPRRYFFEAKKPLELANTLDDNKVDTLVPASTQKKALLDPWAKRMFDSDNDPLAPFLNEVSWQQSPKKEIRVSKVQLATNLQSTLYPATNYVFTKRNYKEDTIVEDASPLLDSANTDVKRREALATLDVFGQQINENFDTNIHEWLESEAFITDGVPTKKLKIDSLLRIFPEQRESILVGMAKNKIFAWLGAPNKSRQVGDVVTWQYVSENCIVSVYLYSVGQIPAHLKERVTPRTLSTNADRVAAFAESYQRTSSEQPCAE